MGGRRARGESTVPHARRCSACIRRSTPSHGGGSGTPPDVRNGFTDTWRTWAADTPWNSSVITMYSPRPCLVTRAGSRSLGEVSNAVLPDGDRACDGRGGFRDGAHRRQLGSAARHRIAARRARSSGSQSSQFAPQVDGATGATRPRRLLRTRRRCRATEGCPPLCRCDRCHRRRPAPRTQLITTSFEQTPPSFSPTRCTAPRPAGRLEL